MQLSWFRAPTTDDAGTTNLCYQVLDLRIVRGHASDVAVQREGESLDLATLLERVAGLAGAMKGVGVTPGDRLAVLLDDPLDELLAFLAALRIAAVPVFLPDDEPTAVIEESSPALVVTSRVLTYADHVPAAVFLRGLHPEDARRDLDWDIAVKAGRTDPAGSEPVSGDSTAYVVGRAVTVAEVPADDSRLALQLATLADGGCLDLTDRSHT